MTEPPTVREPRVRALELAFRRLNRRESTEHELRHVLAGRHFDEATVEAVLAQLCEEGYVDDARYAQLYVADRRILDGWGEERIRRGLTERGVDRELVARALSEAADGEAGEPETELDRALAVLERRFPQLPGDRRERERALRVLLRKGYGSEVALDAVQAHARRVAESPPRYYDCESANERPAGRESPANRMS